MAQALKIINDFGWKSNDPRRQMFYCLAIFENKILCLGTEGQEYFICKLCLFRKQFRSLHEDAARCYLTSKRGVL